MKKSLLIATLLIFGVVLILGCTGSQQSTTQNYTTPQPQPQSQQTNTTTQPASQPPVQTGITNCTTLVSEAQLTSACAGVAQSLVWSHNVSETGKYDFVTKILLKSVCGDVYKKTDSSKANLGEIELVVFENGQQGSRDICAEQGSQPLSGVGDNACMFTNGVSTEIGFVKGDYYIFIGPSNSITTVACNSSQTLAVAKVVAANI